MRSSDVFPTPPRDNVADRGHAHAEHLADGAERQSFGFEPSDLPHFAVVELGIPRFDTFDLGVISPSVDGILNRRCPGEVAWVEARPVVTFSVRCDHAVGRCSVSDLTSHRVNLAVAPTAAAHGRPLELPEGDMPALMPGSSL